MRKMSKILAIFLMIAIVFNACKPEETIPDINVAFQVDPATPAAGDEITFTNSSNGGTAFEWTFGDESSASTDESPKHTYTTSGTYTVTLKVDGYDELTYTKDVVVADQVPTYTSDKTQIQIYEAVTLTAAVYNPESAAVTYKWEFPKDAVMNPAGETGIDAEGVATTEAVKVVFTSPEESTGHAVKLTATIGADVYTYTYNVVVKNELAKTLFIAVKDGNIFTKKLFSVGDAAAADLGVPGGSHPLTIQYANDRLYVFDAGSTITFSADPQTSIGSIKSYAADGTGYIGHIPEFGGHVYGDAFFGYVDDTYIYFTDRNNDVTRIAVDSENLEWVTASGTVNPDNVPALVANSGLGYYSAWAPAGSPSYGWGALNGTFMVYNNMYWWAKNSNHKGLWRFTDADIGVTGTYPTSGGILTEYTVRAFVIDEVNQKIYFSSNKTNFGLYVADIDGSNVTLIDDSPADGEGGDNELTYITGIVVDNDAGYVYWAYRGPALDADGNEWDYDANPLVKSGIKQYKLDGTGAVEYLEVGIEAYGLAIDHTKN